MPARGLCSYGGTSWLMLVDALTGKSLDVGAFDLTGDSQFNQDDKVSINILGTATDATVSGVQIDGGISKGVAVVDTDGNSIKLDSSTSSGKIDEHTISKLLGGRQSWLQIR
jgi:type IV pilus assembly protein PilY1